jgi:hypothetical protein
MFRADPSFLSMHIVLLSAEELRGNPDWQEVRIFQQRGYVFIVSEPQRIQGRDLVTGKQLSELLQEELMSQRPQHNECVFPKAAFPFPAG